MLLEAEPNRTQHFKMLQKGAVVEIEIEWNCYFGFLKYLTQKECFPNYSFRRFSGSLKNSNLKGFNFRYSEKYEKNGVIRRSLVKAFGLRFKINVIGRAGKFSIFKTLNTIGSNIPYFTCVIIIVTYIITNFGPHKNYFTQLIYYQEELDKDLTNKH